MRAATLFALGCVGSLLVAFAGCGDDAAVRAADAGGPRDDDGGSSGSTSSSGSSGSSDAADGAPTPLQPAIDPPPPVFPATVGTLSVGVRTDPTAAAGTNDPIEVCFSATALGPAGNCRRLDIPSPVNDFRVGGFDRYHFEGVALPRSEAKFVIVRPVAGSGADALRVACLDLRFDGEAVHCADNLAQLIGSGAAAGEVPELRQAVANACTTCEAGKLVHGPKLGPSGKDKVRVWVRTDATRKVGLFLSDTPDGAGEVPVGWAYPRPEDDFAATIASSSPLDPNRTYYYRLGVEADVKTPFRRVRTELPQKTSVRLGLGSCAKNDAQPIYAAIGAAKPDFFLFLGDNHYGNTPELAVHRYQYRNLDALAGRTALLGDVHTLATWDDHDYVENNSDGLCAGRATALRAFKEAWPTAELGTVQAPGTFSSTHAGPVDLIMLDCRSYRPRVNDAARMCDPGAVAPAGQDMNAGPLGEPQYQWLISQLSTSSAPFKLVSCGSLVTSMAGIDSWFSFPAARARLFGELATRNIQGVVFASGDIHRSELRKLDRAGTYPMYELVSSPMARDAANGCPNEPDPNRIACYGGGNSFITVDVDGTPADPTFVARILDEAGVERSKLSLSRSQLQ